MTQFSPPEDPGAARRTILAFALAMLFLVGAEYWASRNGPHRNPAAPEPAPSSQAAPAGAPTASPLSSAASSGAPSAASSAPLGAAAVPQPAAVPSRAAASEAEAVVESEQFRVTFTNRGAQVKSWVLKKYQNDRRQPLELVNAIAAPKYGYPFCLWTYDEALRARLSSALYEMKATDTASAGNQAERTISFDYAEGGLVVHKAFTFDLERSGKKGEGALGYVVGVDVSVSQNGTPVEALVAWPSGFGDQTVESSYSSAVDLWSTGERNWVGNLAVNRTAAGGIKGGATITGNMPLAGASDQYFAAVFLPDQPQDAAMVTLRNQIAIPKNLEKPDLAQTVNVNVIGAAAGNRLGRTTGRYFVGPKALEVLDRVHVTAGVGEQLGSDLEPLVDFGKILGWLAKGLFVALEWLHDHVLPNWGWAIVLMTVLINAVMLPLRFTGLKSMMKMQKVKPQMDAIQAKYKKYKPTDPRRTDMNKEIAELYKREGVNPVSGCLPMFLQMPVWIAFYTMLGIAIELRQAGWLWIHDLSSPDPYYALPILTVVTMVLLQLISPQPGGDPVQQKLMLVMMPLMFGYFSYRVASGLALYWVWSSVVGIIFQVWLNNSAFGREMRVSMAKRKK
ncbi:MAG: membrane protein insertase YidC [Acidobacteria bacterium]|nr:membrane protein insertase YidC [Acidobacteriota bacterium]